MKNSLFGGIISAADTIFNTPEFQKYLARQNIPQPYGFALVIVEDKENGRSGKISIGNVSDTTRHLAFQRNLALGPASPSVAGGMRIGDWLISDAGLGPSLDEVMLYLLGYYCDLAPSEELFPLLTAHEATYPIIQDLLEGWDDRFGNYE